MSTCCRRATRAARPGRTSRPGWPTPRPAIMSGRGGSSSATTRCRRSTAGSATTRARASATAPSLDSAVSIHCVERFLGDLALERGWRSTRRRRRSGKRVLVIGAGPSGLSAAYHLARLGHEVEIRDAGRAARRDDALRHPGLPDAARRARRRAGPDRRARRAHHLRAPGRGPGRRAARRRLRRGLRRGRRAPVQAGRHPGRGRRADRRRGLVPAQRRLGRAAGDRPAGRRLRRRQHRDGRRPRRPPARRERRD